MPQTRSVCVCIFIGTGSRYEPDHEAGASHFIEHLLFKGTQKRPASRDISEAIEGVGGVFNGGTGKEAAVYWCKVAQHHLNLALDVLVDMVLHSKFDPEEMERERLVILEEIKMNKDVPAQQVDVLIDELLWPNHPLGRDIAGTKESVCATTRDILMRYLDEHYQPDNAVVAIAGNIQHEAAIESVNSMLGKWARKEKLPQFVPYQESKGKKVQIEQKETEQAHLCLALPGLSLFAPERYALDLLNIVLGEGMSSRLFVELRDKMGLAYSIHSFVDHYLDSGSMVVYAGVEPKNLEKTIKAILEQLALLKDKPVPEAELTKAKEFSKGRLLLRMEDSRNVASWLGGQEILLKEILTPDEVLEKVDRITATELQKLAQKLLVSDRLRLAVVGPIPRDTPLDKLLKM